jgi:hypothetical protein
MIMTTPHRVCARIISHRLAASEAHLILLGLIGRIILVKSTNYEFHVMQFLRPVCHFPSVSSRQCHQHLCIVYSAHQIFFPKSKRPVIIKSLGKILDHEEFFLVVLYPLLTSWETRCLPEERCRRCIRNFVKLLPAYAPSPSVRYFSYSPH